MLDSHRLPVQRRKATATRAANVQHVVLAGASIPGDRSRPSPCPSFAAMPTLCFPTLARLHPREGNAEGNAEADANPGTILPRHPPRSGGERSVNEREGKDRRAAIQLVDLVTADLHVLRKDNVHLRRCWVTEAGFRQPLHTRCRANAGTLFAESPGKPSKARRTDGTNTQAKGTFSPWRRALPPNNIEPH